MTVAIIGEKIIQNAGNYFYLQIATILPVYTRKESKQF